MRKEEELHFNKYQNQNNWIDICTLNGDINNKHNNKSNMCHKNNKKLLFSLIMNKKQQLHLLNQLQRQFMLDKYN